MKICSKCHLFKDEECFSKGGHGSRKTQCKDCDKQYRITHKSEQQAYDKQYYQNKKKLIYEANKAVFKEKSAQYYQDNKEEIKNRVREYAAENIEKIKENKKAYYEENKEIILEKSKEYYYDNWEESKLIRKNYRLSHKKDRNQTQKLRYDNDPIFKLRTLLSTSVLKYLKIAGSSKNGKSISKYFSYSPQELKVHLENQFDGWMNWDNHGKYDASTWDDNNQNTWTWQIDHIIPHSKLPYTNMDDENFKKCWALNNLRPLNAKQNNRDGNKR